MRVRPLFGSFCRPHFGADQPRRPQAPIDGGASGVTMARAGPHPRRARHSGQRARGTDGWAIVAPLRFGFAVELSTGRMIDAALPWVGREVPLDRRFRRAGPRVLGWHAWTLLALWLWTPRFALGKLRLTSEAVLVVKASRAVSKIPTNIGAVIRRATVPAVAARAMGQGVARGEGNSNNKQQPQQTSTRPRQR